MDTGNNIYRHSVFDTEFMPRLKRNGCLVSMASVTRSQNTQSEIE